MLTQTEEILRLQGQTELAVQLLNQWKPLGQGISPAQPLATPADYKGHSSTAMYELQLSRTTRQRIVQCLEDAVVDGITTQATATRGLGGFVEAWREYAQYVGCCRSGDE